jgi:hypothetical protein
MIAVEFIEVGRNKRSWTAPMKELDEDALYRSVRKHGAVMSRDLSFLLEDETNGAVLAGFHKIGTFRIVESREVVRG